MAKHNRHEHEGPTEAPDEVHETPVAEGHPTTMTLVIQGLTFTILAPYAAGHVITPGEARALNQTRAENLRNNFAKKVDAAKGENATVPEEVFAELQKGLSEYEQTYSFEKVKSSGPRLVHADPVEKEALRQATLFVEAALNNKGIQKKSVKPENFKQLVQDVLAKRPEIREAARRHVEAMSAIGHEAIASLEGSSVELNEAA